jgi:hypothetical protein
MEIDILSWLDDNDFNDAKRKGLFSEYFDLDGYINKIHTDHILYETSIKSGIERTLLKYSRLSNYEMSINIVNMHFRNVNKKATAKSMFDEHLNNIKHNRHEESPPIYAHIIDNNKRPVISIDLTDQCCETVANFISLVLYPVFTTHQYVLAANFTEKNKILDYDTKFDF